ncbi:Hydroxymethylpyrimidine pyrophosphatase [Acetitomaculum ruminis DSM 5522]|uniref:Hydroxymethylpyrimidine pyrophosphatase n=1 Tax=Acetitomaculum ruminis DSM 5522 TaxID=1120918 RepID=A0A1I0YCC0_9FIRM|nr:HAD family hydrolase [Acetitomaculum ruminis]SFB10832.1 Hydroxymethylpyrimidine pyrophosphatase [Acetitomaculum ruminis DSM 5522]
MKAFLSDLDNTLIYSYKHDIGADKCLVENYNGMGISFMTGYSHSLLTKIRKEIEFVPVTTRSISQYERIFFGGEEVKYALTDNGGNLLINGKIDEKWHKESMTYFKKAEKEIDKAREILEKDKNRSMEVRLVDGFFAFTKSDDEEKTKKTLHEALDNTKVNIFNNGVKVYVFPKELDKGLAVKRFRKRFEIEKIITAGDSLFDVPMLLNGDISIIPPQLKEYFEEKNEKGYIYAKEDRIFSDIVLESVLKNI